MNTCAPDGVAVPAPLMTPIVLLLNATNEHHMMWKSCWIKYTLICLVWTTTCL